MALSPYLPLVGRSGVALATLGWGSGLAPPVAPKKRDSLPIKGRDEAFLS